MCVSSSCNIVFPCKILTLIIKTVQLSVTSVNFGFILNVINWTTLIVSTFKDIINLWYCISCCDEILPFGTLANKNFLSLVNPRRDDCFTSNSDAYISKNSSLSLKPSSDLSLLFNQFNNSSPEQKSNPANVVNSNYYDNDQLQTLEFPEKNKFISIPHKCWFFK